MKLRPLTLADNPSISVDCIPECLSVREAYTGSALNVDEEEQRIAEKLAKGNLWAWCTVRITVQFCNVTGRSYLGCCSYLSADDFRCNSGCYDDMVQEALEELNYELAQIAKGLDTLVIP